MIVGNLPPINPSEFYGMTVKAQSLRKNEKGNVMWRKVKKLPKKTDFYLISDGVDYSVGIFDKDKQIFIDKNIDKPITHNSIKYWSKIAELPIEKSKYFNIMLKI